ncbi:MAG: hypothetical protein II137_02110 [Anaerovibrio sp.]|uniref:hypothetical protein n=1 Tax=Anaerovibrio lipolyticus TaxID=82374 RepID=UPI0012DCB5B9|nr:hypothetical protein [Anaerovibrio lipolyticus]MBQ1855373.1 hypothetical protein [Anaerovibrio sp.]
MEIGGINGYMSNPYAAQGPQATDGKGVGPEHQIKPGKKSSPAECQTCKNRKYTDGSDEMVSFKAPGHIDPNNAAAVVLGHEQEHVSNAYNKARNNNGHVERATVRLKTDICPECGRSYISGGETNTQIKYYNEDNPYQKDLKQTDAVKYRGANVDIAA